MRLSNFLMESADSFERRTYSFEKAGSEYDVSKLYKYAEQHMPLISIPTASLVHNLERERVNAPAFRRRAMKSSLDYPIAVHKVDGKYWAIDGSHRIMKADELKKKYMKTYVFVGNLPAKAQVK